jgi:hypothetical protein
MPLPRIELLLNFYCFHLGEEEEDQYDEDFLFGGDVEGGFGSSSEEESENFENLETVKKDYSHELDIDLDHQTDNQTKPSTRKIENNESIKNRDDSKLKRVTNSTNRESIQDRNNSKLNKKPQTDNKESNKHNFRDRNISELRRTIDSTNNRESNKDSFRATNDSQLKRTSQSENNDYFREFSTSKSTKTVHQNNIGDSNKTNYKEKDKIRKQKVPLVQIRISKPALSEEKKRRRTESGKIFWFKVL